MFKQGPILELSKAAGSVTRVIHLNFHVTNVEQICFIMHRLVFVDAHSVRVCSIPDPKAAEQVSELVWVPLGPQGNSNNVAGKEDNLNAHVMGCNSDGSGGKVISWRSYIEDAMDRPRILWDGSFLWISETHLRKTDDNQLKTPSYLWHWCVVCLAAIVTMSSIFLRRVLLSFSLFRPFFSDGRGIRRARGSVFLSARIDPPPLQTESRSSTTSALPLPSALSAMHVNLPGPVISSACGANV